MPGWMDRLAHRRLMLLFRHSVNQRGASSVECPARQESLKIRTRRICPAKYSRSDLIEFYER